MQCHDGGTGCVSALKLLVNNKIPASCFLSYDCSYPLFPWNKLGCTHVLKKRRRKKHFYVPCFPNRAFVPLKRWHLFPSSPEINVIFPISQNPCEGLNYWQWVNYLLIFDFHTTDLNLLGEINIIELMLIMLMSSFERRTRYLSKQCRPWYCTYDISMGSSLFANAPL